VREIPKEPEPKVEGFLSPASIFAALEEKLTAAVELRARTEGAADSFTRERSASRFLIGIVTASFEVSDVDHPFFGALFRGIRGRLAAGSGDLLLCCNRPAQPDDPWRVAALERTIEHGADALILWGVGTDDPEIGSILARNIPAVFVDMDPIGKRAGYVMSDNVAAMAEVVKHLRETGRKRIAHIAGSLTSRPGPDRLLGYRSELARAGLPTPEEYVEHGDYYHRSAFEATKRLLALPEPPDAVTCASDAMAIGAILAIEEAGLRVPEDIAVTGFDDAGFASSCRPPLTTVRQDSEGLGAAAAEAILRMLERPKAAPPALVLPTELIVRESSGAPSGDS
jgi:LacI family transcriptional regulator